MSQIPPPPPYQQPGQFQPTPPPPFSNVPGNQQGYPYKQPRPPRSGFKALMVRRVSLPVWVLLVAAFVILGMLSTYTQSIEGLAHDQTPTSEPSSVLSSTPKLPPTPTIKPTPTHPPKWTTVRTFQGNGNKKTTLFTVPDSWRLVWSCDPSSDYSGEYNVMVDVKGSDGSDVDPVAVNTICKAGNTGDSTQEYQGGNLYLDVASEAVWKIQVQVLK